MLHMGEQREPQEGHQHKGDTSKATGSANCFHRGSVDVLGGGKGLDTDFFLQAPISMKLFLTHCFQCWVMQPLIPSAVSPLSLHTHQEHLMTNSPSEFSPYLISAVANRVQFHSKPLSVYLPRKLAGGKDKTFLRQKSLL